MPQEVFEYAIEQSHAVYVKYPDGLQRERESAMIKAFIFGTVALALSAANASADGYRYGYGHHYGYAVPVFEYEAGAYYGFPAPSYTMNPWPIYAAVPIHAAPRPYDYAPGYWGGYGYGWR